MESKKVSEHAASERNTDTRVHSFYGIKTNKKSSHTSVSRKKKTVKRKLRKCFYISLSFILSVLLTAVLILTTLQTTVLNPEFIYKHMEKTNYFSGKQYEIKEAFIDIGYASGLNEEFWNKLADEDMIRDDTVTYLYNYYSGEGSVVDITNFEEKMRDSLDEYILKNNIKNVDKSAIKYLIVITRSTYKAHLELPLFSRIAYYMVVARKTIPVIISILALIIALICFAYVYKNKAEGIKYICYGTSSTFLITIVIPLAVLISDKIKYLNLSSEALYNLIVSAFNSTFIIMLILSVVCLAFSIILFSLYMSLTKKQKRRKTNVR